MKLIMRLCSECLKDSFLYEDIGPCRHWDYREETTAFKRAIGKLRYIRMKQDFNTLTQPVISFIFLWFYYLTEVVLSLVELFLICKIHMSRICAKFGFYPREKQYLDVSISSRHREDR